MENNVLILPSVLANVWKSEYKSKLADSENPAKMMFYQDIVVSHTTQEYKEDVSKNEDVPKGYLIWHEMGTGKTLTGLNFLKTFADKTNARVEPSMHNNNNNNNTDTPKTARKKVLGKKKTKGGHNKTDSTCEKYMCNVHASFPNTQVKSVKGEADYAKLMKEIDPIRRNLTPVENNALGNINRCKTEEKYCEENTLEMSLCKTILSYEDISDYLTSIRKPPTDHKLHVGGVEFEFDDKIIVFDEAQKLIDIFRDDRISKVVRNWFFFRIRKARRYLFLSGTPLYQKTIDLSFYINMCQGGEPKKPLLSFSERIFHKEYFKVVRWKQVLFGWVVPLLNNVIVKNALMLFTAGLLTAQLINVLKYFSSPDLLIMTKQFFDKDGKYLGSAQVTGDRTNNERSTAGIDKEMISTIDNSGVLELTDEEKGELGTLTPEQVESLKLSDEQKAELKTLTPAQVESLKLTDEQKTALDKQTAALGLSAEQKAALDEQKAALDEQTAALGLTTEQKAALDEQTAALDEQTAALDEQKAALDEQKAALDEQTAAIGLTTEQKAALDEQKVALDEQTAALDEQTAALDEQTAALDEQKEALNEQTAALGLTTEQKAALDEQTAALDEQKAALNEQIDALGPTDKQKADFDEQKASLDEQKAALDEQIAALGPTDEQKAALEATDKKLIVDQKTDQAINTLKGNAESSGIKGQKTDQATDMIAVAASGIIDEKTAQTKTMYKTKAETIIEKGIPGADPSKTKTVKHQAYSQSKVKGLLSSGFAGSVLKKFAVAAGFGTHYGKKIGKKYDQGSGEAIGLVWVIPMLSTMILCGLLNKLASYDLNKIHVLNTKKLSAVIGKYMSFYTFKPPSTTLIENLSNKIKKKCSDDYKAYNYNSDTAAYDLRKKYPHELINKQINLYDCELVDNEKKPHRVGANNQPEKARVVGIKKRRGKSTLHKIEVNEGDGTKTYTVKLAKGLDLPSGCNFSLDHEQIKNEQTRHFKTEVFKKKVIPYNFVQHYLFLDVTTGIVEPSNSSYFEEDDDNSTGQSNSDLYDYPYDIFGDDMYENDYYMKQGRVIGNLTISPDPKAHAGKVTLSKFLLTSPKAMSYNEKITDKERMAPAESTLAMPDKDDCIAYVDSLPTKLPIETPIKFLHMLHDILIQKKRNGEGHAHAVVYSSFRKNGTHAFLRFIEGLKKNVEISIPFQKNVGSEFFTKLVCKFYDPNLDPRKPVGHADAKGNELAVVAETGEPIEPYDVLFLEPSMTEGVSIHRGECLHIMEPIINPNMMDQLKARVNRYNPKGFAKETNVRVILYECSAKKHLKKLMNKMKHWSEKTDRGRIFWRRFKVFNQDLSPDFLVHQKAEKLRYTIKQLSEMLVQACSLNHTKVIYSKLDHKKYIVEDIESRSQCKFCRLRLTQKKKTDGGAAPGGSRGRRMRTRRRMNTKRTRRPHMPMRRTRRTMQTN